MLENCKKGSKMAALLCDCNISLKLQLSEMWSIIY